MGQILVRNIDDAVKDKLRALARKHGHSVEEEVHNLIRNAVKDQAAESKGLGTEIAERFRGLELDRPIPKLKVKLRIPKFD
jgi:antitoxin FitA